MLVDRMEGTKVFIRMCAERPTLFRRLPKNVLERILDMLSDHRKISFFSYHRKLTERGGPIRHERHCQVLRQFKYNEMIRTLIVKFCNDMDNEIRKLSYVSDVREKVDIIHNILDLSIEHIPHFPTNVLGNFLSSLRNNVEEWQYVIGHEALKQNQDISLNARLIREFCVTYDRSVSHAHYEPFLSLKDDVSIYM